MLDQFNVTQTSVAANSWSTCINRKEVIRHEKLFLQLKKNQDVRDALDVSFQNLFTF